MIKYSVPKRKSFIGNLSVTNSLILINVACFAIFLIVRKIVGPSVDMYSMLKPSDIFQGKYLWTFLTSMFLHANFFHLAVNMISLFSLGKLVERIIGSKRYVLLYLASGLFAGIFFVLFSYSLGNLCIGNIFGKCLGSILFGNPEIPAVGASGALFGLIGLLMILTPNLPLYVMFIPIPVKLKYAAPGILIVFWLISSGGGPQFGNLAHLGGFIAGLVYGFYLKNRYKKKTKYINKMFS